LTHEEENGGDLPGIARSPGHHSVAGRRAPLQQRAPPSRPHCLPQARGKAATETRSRSSISTRRPHRLLQGENTVMARLAQNTF